MNIYKNEDTDNVNLYESGIVGIHFNNGATQIVFDIDWSESYDAFSIVCNYCSMLDFCFKHEDEHLGELTITGFSYIKKVDGEGYTIQFNFDYTPRGYIRLYCYEFYFHVPSSPSIAGGNNHRIPWDPVKLKDPLDYEPQQ